MRTRPTSTGGWAQRNRGVFVVIWYLKGLFADDLTRGSPVNGDAKLVPLANGVLTSCNTSDTNAELEETEVNTDGAPWCVSRGATA